MWGVHIDRVSCVRGVCVCGGLLCDCQKKIKQKRKVLARYTYTSFFTLFISLQAILFMNMLPIYYLPGRGCVTCVCVCLCLWCGGRDTKNMYREREWHTHTRSGYTNDILARKKASPTAYAAACAPSHDTLPHILARKKASGVELLVSSSAIYLTSSSPLYLSFTQPPARPALSPWCQDFRKEGEKRERGEGGREEHKSNPSFRTFRLLELTTLI